MSAAEIQALAQQNLQRATSARPDTASPNAQTAGVAWPIRLKVTEVVPYERNPRQVTHERIAELKESIRINGIEQIVTVTKRPQQAHYVVAKGGNSRLLAAQALYEETGDPRFLYRDFLVIDYPGEAKLLAAHLRENEQRAELCFWDKANGYLALKADLEQEYGRALSLREFSRILADEGTPVSHALLALFRFAVERLRGLGEATSQLSARDIALRLQPALGALVRLTRKLGHDEKDFQQRIVEPELEQTRLAFEATRTLDVGRLVDAFHCRCASVIEVEPAGLKRMLAIVERVPEATADDLRAGLIGEPRATSPVAPTAADDDSRPDADGGTNHPIFRQALDGFAEVCGLTPCLRAAPTLPYDFMVEPPTLNTGEAALDRQAQASHAGLLRYQGWWWLVGLSQQNTPTGLAVLPAGEFARIATSDDVWQSACEQWIGEPLLADRCDLMIRAMLDPTHAGGGRYLRLLHAARAFRATYPHRFVPQFWLAQGVDARLLETEEA